MSCKNFHIVNTITVSTTFVVLSFSETVSVEDMETICFKMKESIPDSARNLPVYIFVNGANTPLWDKYGNPLKGKALRKCFLYGGYYGATASHVILPKIPRTFNYNAGINL